MTLQQSALTDLTRPETYQRREMERISFARELIEELMPHLPHSLDEHFTVEGMWTGYLEPERSTYALRLETREGLAPDAVPQAFGSIIKVAAALLRLGWSVDPQPEITAADGRHAIDVEIKAPRGQVGLRVSFLHLPESERCKLVEEDVTVPEHIETKLRVECEGEPVRLVDTPAPPLAEAVPVLEEATP